MSRFNKAFNRVFLVLLLALLINIPAFAEFIPLLGMENFENSLSFPEYGGMSYLVREMDPSEAASRNGIIFSGEWRSSITTNKVEDFHDGISQFVGGRFIEHVPGVGISSSEGIVIRFKYPVKKFGLSLSAGSSISIDDFEYPESASLRAYSVNGQLVGTTEVGSEISSLGKLEIAEKTFGFETTSGPGITTVILDYGESDIPERIRKVYYKYKEARPFKIILPQLAHGTVSGASIECDLIIYWDRSVTIRNYSSGGGLLDPPILKEGSNFTLSKENMTDFPAGPSAQYLFHSTTIPGAEELVVGYVVAESDYPVDGQIVYRTIDTEGKVHEADIRACTRETFLQTSFEINQAENLNAAIVITNPGNTSATVEVHVSDFNQKHTDFLHPPVITLKPSEQKALFMWELWDQMPWEDGRYTLQLRSSDPFAAAAFYTRNWIVVGNLPVWSYKEGQAR